MSGDGPLYHHTPLQASDEPYDEATLAQLTADSKEIISRYPQKRSALLPMLHLIQSVDGYVTGRGVNLCAELLDLTAAEVSGVATFYTQYKRHPNGEYTVGVCTNTLCAIMGGDQIFDELSDHLGVGHDETTPDGKVTLERVECNAACDYAPVVMVNWEFFDNQDLESSKKLVDDLRDGTPVKPSRGANSLCSFRQMSRVLAGFNDGRADEGVSGGPASLEGVKLAKERGWVAPGDVYDNEGRVAGAGTSREGTQPTAGTEQPQPGEEFSSADFSREARTATDGDPAEPREDSEEDGS